MSNLHIRPFKPGDEPDLAMVCCKTGDSGKDATGKYPDDNLLGALFVLPYAKNNPDLSWVIEDRDAPSPGVVGYIVGTPDSEAFYKWFHNDWWPEASKQFERPPKLKEGEKAPAEMWMWEYADNVGSDMPKEKKESEDYPDPTEEYPAHMHIDLLPEAQGKGFGKKMIHILLEELRKRGVKGLHLGASAENHGGCAFYEKIGFKEIPSPKGSRRFVWKLD